MISIVSGTSIMVLSLVRVFAKIRIATGTLRRGYRAGLGKAAVDCIMMMRVLLATKAVHIYVNS